MINRLKRISRRHNCSIARAILIESFVQIYKVRFFRKILRSFYPHTSSDVHFVLGCYNSGTTVVKNAIALHDCITIAPIEGDLLTSSLDTYESDGWPRCMYANSKCIFEDRIDNKLNKEAILKDWSPWTTMGKVFLEKSISNSVRVPSLRKAFANSKYIYVTRNLEGVVEGIQRRSTPNGPATLICGKEYSYNLLKAQWVFFNKLIIEDSVGQNDILFISYEKFLNNPKVELEIIFSFLNLPSREVLTNNGLLECCGNSLMVNNKKVQSTQNDYLDSREKLICSTNKALI